MNTQHARADYAPASHGSGNAKTVRPVDHIEEVLRTAEAKLQELVRERAEIVRRIGAIKRTIVGVTKLCGNEALSPSAQQILRNNGAIRTLGLTDSCRRVLMEASHPLSARAICAELEKRDDSLLARHKDPVASVTTVLNRLARYGEASAVAEGGRSAWLWSTEAHEALLNDPGADPLPVAPDVSNRSGIPFFGER